MAGLLPIVAREEELSELGRGLRDASEGHGGIWFLLGEPGIGKTRLAEEIAARAVEQGVMVLWGRCWEAGGAPAYWPWIEVLRALFRSGRDAAAHETFWQPRAPVLSQLLPELTPLARETAPPLDAERARFQLLEAVVATLCDASRSTTLLVIVEDLHMADASTVSVLSLLHQQARNARLAVIGTLRDADGQLAASGSALLALVRTARCLPLARLDPAQVAQFLALSSGSETSAPTAEAVYRTTEGNPLFVTEVARLLATEPRAAAASASIAIPRSVRHAIRARLARLSPRTTAALEIASVMGREFRALVLSQLSGRTLGELAGPLTEALDSGVLLETAPGEYRFSHVLLREVLHQDLSEDRRSQLHLDAAEALRRRSPIDPPWSEIAHHCLEAGPRGRALAVEACSEAARAAQRQLAFADAAEWYTRALAALGQDPSVDLARRGHLLLCLADAQLHSGAIELGHASCMRAAAIARELHDGELLARSALAYGTVLQFAVVDPQLVALLREALSALPEAPLPVRAVTMARLAAAEQPAPEPQVAFGLARDAIAMARANGDPGTLLDTLRFAISALMDLAEPRERLELNREYVRLAQSLGQPLEALRGTMRQTFDHLELGDALAVSTCIESISSIAESLGHPFYTWRASAFRAMQATFEGRFAAARDEIERAERLGREGRDPNALRAALMQRHTIARLRDAEEELTAMMPEIARAMQGSELGALVVRIMAAEALLRSGRADRAAAHVSAADLARVVRYGDTSAFAPLANVALAFGMREIAEAARECIRRRGGVFASGGMTTMSFGEPLVHITGTLHRTAGHLDEAEHCYERAIAHAEQAGGRPFAAWAAHDLADLLLSRGGEDRLARARTLLSRVAAEADELDMPGLGRRARALLDAAGHEQPRVDASRRPAADGVPAVLAQDGESWLVSWAHVSVRLQDSKGLRWLAQLVREPEREFHVLDLVGADGPRDAGDAGEVLDAEARTAYRARARELEAEIADAEADADLGRVARLRGELEFLHDELRRAMGLGGRERRAGVAAERARINVQRRLRDAIRRIASLEPDLGRHFERSLKTGVFCSYRP